NVYEPNLGEKRFLVESAANRLGITVLLKGPTDVVSNGITSRLNKTGTPAMTVGGTGDVLVGIVGAFLARGVPLLESAGIGAFLSGLAGESAERELGPNILPTDVIQEIPKILRDLTKE
ncbi:MAG: ADP-dependent NAD(P)H-hydrate dehydratase, partial [Promethearchaeota archaeon]